MEPQAPNTIGSSLVMESCISGQSAPQLKNSYSLEINIISAQDLAPVSKSMQPYAVSWIYPDRKNITQIDQEGQKNPKWNEKFNFRLKDGMPEDATITVEIYTLSWFRDVLVGNVSVPIRDLIAPLAQTSANSNKNTRFVTLQIRTSSGSPQGILNIGVTLRDGASIKSSPLNRGLLEEHGNSPIDEHKKELISKIEMWRSMSTGSGPQIEDFTLKPGSIVNGSMCDNGSEICSDIGPSASVVAAEMAMKLMPPPPPPPRRKRGGAGAHSDDSSSILGDMTLEQAKARGYQVMTKDRWRRMAANDGDDSELSVRHTKPGREGSLFSCFAVGIEFTIVCGSSKNPINNKTSSKKKKSGDKK
ncbi:hypothetical protein SASPL_139204 [Salvia splendens]|uniref:C2 domain-containing protein n=1 Tax=Salvia splendens TaxID=180675 RepID=A0A8X8ZEV2_SALSN|nr:uncharacterized protein LOC121764544 [Salvia splendens]KAG6402326.1 hypothetical protein SASPL_139204 [Salvia splendens]